MDACTATKRGEPAKIVLSIQDSCGEKKKKGLLNIILAGEDAVCHHAST
jgi:hypothetical protein